MSFIVMGGMVVGAVALIGAVLHSALRFGGDGRSGGSGHAPFAGPAS